MLNTITALKVASTGSTQLQPTKNATMTITFCTLMTLKAKATCSRAKEPARGSLIRLPTADWVSFLQLSIFNLINFVHSSNKKLKMLYFTGHATNR